MSEIQVFDLPLLLPEVPDERDACVSRLTDSLRVQPGVEAVQVVEAVDEDPARLHVRYDPRSTSRARIRRSSIRAGAQITEQIGHVVWQASGISRPVRARTVAERLRRVYGVLDVQVAATGVLRIEFDRRKTGENELRDALRRMGAVVPKSGDVARRPRRDHGGGDAPVSESGHDETGHDETGHDETGHSHGGLFGENTELAFAVLSGILVGSGWLLGWLSPAPDWVPFALYLGAYLFGGFFSVREAVDSVRVGRFEIDFLMLVAAGGAAALGEWLDGALLLFLFSTGHALEHYAMGKARRAIAALGDLAPDTAVVRRDREEREIPVEELSVGDVVLVRTNQRIPADGFVSKGTSSVNQAPVTGESVPVDKRPVENVGLALETWKTLAPEYRVFAGTINGSGALEVVATKRAGESTLARVVQMVTEAEADQSPTQQFTDRFERVFVPAVLGFVVLLLFAGLVIDESFATTFYRAMAVLVAASPCALAIATPSAVLSGMARAGQGGVLVKGGGPLENLGRLSAIAFDKTGTLTEGTPRVADVVASPGVEAHELLSTALAVEKLSDHPLAGAVVRHAEAVLAGRRTEAASDLEGLIGRGIKATVGGDVVHIGKDDLFREVEGPGLPEEVLQTVEHLERQGRTTMIVRRGERYLGVLGLMDTPREGAREVIEALRRIGIRRMVMISGDNQRVADAVARQVGLDEARGDLLPEDKVETIRMLRQEQEVAMIGDGVNDAPAMANATVGIAMGAAGSDVALETADVALMADDLSRLPFAVGLSRQTSRIITQNLWMSLGMVVFLIPATLFGLGIGAAVALHEGSTLIVVSNALRLLGFRETEA
jgi:Zn2+/Cd2+-exporting ATPase